MDRHHYQVGPMGDELLSILEKRAEGPLHAAMELAGLGTLAAPHIMPSISPKSKLTKYLASHKGTRASELAGLGLLAIPSAITLSKAMSGKKKKISRRA
jgi:hypothetical protein